MVQWLQVGTSGPGSIPGEGTWDPANCAGQLKKKKKKKKDTGTSNLKQYLQRQETPKIIQTILEKLA